MDLTRLAIISQKELSDHVTSRRFLLILIITCLVLGVAAANGVTDYYNALENYKNGEGGDLFMPSILYVFNKITNSVGLEGLGAIIGIAIGFDLIAGEREGRSLKTILSQPLYRDELINGKAIGGIITLTIITMAGFLTILALFLIISIVPNLEEIFLIGIIWLLTLLYMTTFFSMALMSSVLAKSSSSSALIISLIILFILLYIIPVGGGGLGTYLLGTEPTDMGYESDSQLQEVYEQKKSDVRDFFNMFSIDSVYNEIASPITMPSHYVINQLGFEEYSLNPDIAEGSKKPSLLGIIGDKWIKIIVFIMWPIVFFGIAYVKFMRVDLR
ncbi:ABC-type transport system involved in multi-copper enzyme maturation permease component-like protein [Methanolacinia petrolearia DSM 11571]|uniref:ABC-type transport system involved in multi-copper enzyme maturation permease component-like protein n=1 Tax=Methanolacinia petrolearia (strain DSM 11571 / OCM 486 / SEBR 4847) TaxID=679926 RepID=E1RJA7_METP4|nr:ABC transporter permease subunit [Methanolacinia petrolearia]ADN35625.1 ABC-type transport system involved in multi-copper enzyme maturation permease component-like protein [Methanolacinia petrolearia DSM 11571]